MNELDYTLRILERGEDDLVLMVPHEVNDAWGNTKEQIAARKAKTKLFCDWIRKQFPHVPTEFRYVNKRRVRDHRYRHWARYKTINTDKHFVAYGLTKGEMMIIKLSWSFQQQVARLYRSPPVDKSFVIELDEFLPTEALTKRLAKEAAK